MYTCMYVYTRIYVCMHAIHSYACMHVCICACMYACMHAHACLCAYVCICVHTCVSYLSNTFSYVCAYGCVYIRVTASYFCIYVCTHMHTYSHTYIYVYTHIPLRMYVRMYAYAYIRIQLLYAYAYIRIYTHTASLHSWTCGTSFQPPVWAHWQKFKKKISALTWFCIYNIHIYIYCKDIIYI